MPKNINMGLVSFVMEELVITLLAFFLTLFNAGFDLEKMNWTIFAFTDIFNIYCRVVATKYASEKEKMENMDVAQLDKILTNRKKAIIKARKQEDVIEAIHYYNYKKSFEIYLELLHNKNDKLKVEKPRQKAKREKYDERIRLVSSLIDKLNQKQYEAYDTLVVEYHLVSYQHKYSDIRYNDLFVGKSKKNKYGEDDIKFNLFTTSVKRALPSWIVLTLVSVYWSCLYGGVKNSADLWFMLGSYAFAIVMGTTWGLNNGQKVIREDLNSTLNTRVNISSICIENANCYDEIAEIITAWNQQEQQRKLEGVK